MDYFLFKSQTGEFVGVRGSLPKEDEGFTAIAMTEESIAKMSTPFEHLLVDGEIVDGEPLSKAVPIEVPLWKLRFILSQMGLEDAVSAAINELPEPTRSAGNYLWSLGTAVDRYSPTVLLIKQVLTMDDSQVDEIFINADSIVL